MDNLKEAFQKVKQDMNFLHSEVTQLKDSLRQTQFELLQISQILSQIAEKIPRKQEKPILTHPTQETTNQTTPTHIPTHQQPLEALKSQNMVFSTGNGGVPTDRQTDQQTDRQRQKSLEMPLKPTDIDHAAQMLDSLDSIKKEIRLKFKRLTEQEILVFSTLWQLDDEQASQEKGQGIEYKVLAQKLNLTESSIRDYVGRLLKKGIPVDKTRINNKTILLSVSKNLKKIASLPTILQLRDL